MTDLDHQDDEPVVLDIADNAKVADAIAPILPELVALKGRAQLARVVEYSKPHVKKRADTVPVLFAEFSEAFLRGTQVFNRPCHARTPQR